MGTWRTVVLALWAAGGLILHSQSVFKSEQDTVVTFATVRNSTTGGLMSGLTREDFELRIDGQPAEITTFSADPQPLSVVLMIDTSASMWPYLVAVRNASLAFAGSLGEGDQLSIGSFSSFGVALSPIWSRRQDILARILTEELWPGPNSPVWAAVGQSVAALGSRPGRRIALVFSDGESRGGVLGYSNTRRDAARAASLSDVMVYFVSPPGADVSPEARRFAAETGGGYFTLSGSLDPSEPMRKLAADLGSQYLVGFAARRDGQPHRVDLSIRNASTASTVTARKSYVAR